MPVDVELLNDAKNAADDSSSATGKQVSSYEAVQQAIDDAIAAHKAQEEALRAEQKAAFEAFKAQEQLAAATERAARSLAVGMGVNEQVVDGLIEIGSAARESAAAADAMSSAFDTLFGRALSESEAFDAFYAQIQGLNEELKVTGEDAVPRLGSALEAAFGVTPAALGFRDAMREGVQGILDYATAATDSGEPVAQITSNIDAMRASLVATGEQYGLTTAESDAFITSLLGTPGLLTTVIQTPGMIEALLNADNLSLLYDEAGNPVITEFEALGIDPAMIDVEAFKLLVENLSKTKGEPVIAAPTIPPVQGEIDDTKGKVEDLDSSKADPTLTVTTAPAVKKLLDDVKLTMDRISETRMTPSISIPALPGVQADVDKLAASLRDLPDGLARVEVTGVNRAKQEVDALAQSIRMLQDKTVTVRTNTVNSTTNGMSGALITTPRNMNVGERGLTEALIPLQLPLNRVDPAVREMAAMLRTPGPTTPMTGAAGKVVNNYMTIQPLSADPSAVATQVINRSAMLANR